MLVEFGVSLYAAVTGQSPVILAFGSDSLIEPLSAAGGLLFVLAFAVAAVAVASLLLRLRPETSLAGIGITLAALIVMPILASRKRHEARHSKNTALAADAVQSAACAYFALIALPRSFGRAKRLILALVQDASPSVLQSSHAQLFGYNISRNSFSKVLFPGNASVSRSRL
jgi:hypothetical protein